MELKQLEYLVACIECGSYSKASEILYTTQANISKVIFKLEDELGYKLLERSRAGVRPTAEGKILYNNSKEILEKTKQIPLRQKTNNDNYFNVVSAFDIDFSYNFFDFTKRRMLETEKINFFMDSNEKIIDYVDNDRADIGFLYTDKFNIDNLKYHSVEKQLELIIIRNAELFLSVGPNNPLFDSKQITIDKLQGQEFVFLGNDSLSLFSENYNTNRLIKKLNLKESIERAILTTSDLFLENILEETERSYPHYSFGSQYYLNHTIKNLKIENLDNDAIWCCIKKKGTKLGNLYQDLINYLLLG